MAGRIPDEHAKPPGKILDLFVEQTMVGGEAGQKDEGIAGGRRRRRNPIMNIAAAGVICFVQHKVGSQYKEIFILQMKMEKAAAR